MRVTAALVLVAGLFGLDAAATAAPADAQAIDVEVVDCLGPVDDEALEGPGYLVEELANVACSQERHLDQAQHPVAASPIDAPLPVFADAYRVPSRHDGVRFRYGLTTIGGLTAEVHRPCTVATCPDLPASLRPVEPPYPAVVTFHGGASNRTLHWWSSQSLAEAGYLVVAFDSAGIAPTVEEAEVVLDWLFARDDPLAADFDGQRLGVAGHSAGGVLVNDLGQRDPRVDAVVVWDRAQSSVLPSDRPLRTPTLSFAADYLCQQSPICQPEPYLQRPDPDGPGNKAQDAALLRAAGVDVMFLVLRASLHLDWTPSEPSGNRYAEAVTVHHTIAWFDRYVRGSSEPAVAREAFERLTADTFGDTADRHNLSQGRYDLARALAAGDPDAGNRPYAIAGLPVADRLSFHFRSRCAITDPGTGDRIDVDDVRVHGCRPTPQAAAPRGGDPVDAVDDADERERTPPPAPPTADVRTRAPLPVTGGGLGFLGALCLGLAGTLRGRRAGATPPRR